MMNHGVAVRVGLLGVALGLASCAKHDGHAPIVCGPPDEFAPAELACTGLYADFDTKEVAKTARLYAPAVSFWSDGYEKSRWIELPNETPIDATSMDDWKFPVGTKVWKEFRFRERKIETRLLWKVKEDHWVQAAYVWAEDGTTATRGEGQSLTIAGDTYRVPSLIECNDCHKGRRTRSSDSRQSRWRSPPRPASRSRSSRRRIASRPPPPEPPSPSIPASASFTSTAASAATTRRRPRTDATPRFVFASGSTKRRASPSIPGSWPRLPSTSPPHYPDGAAGFRIAPGAPDKSVIIASMKARGTGQMPPNARDVDFAGIAAVEAFVLSLPPR